MEQLTKDMAESGDLHGTAETEASQSGWCEKF